MRLSFRGVLSSGGKMVELLFFPSYCELCHGFLEKPGERVICWLCQEKIRPCFAPSCPVCGRFFEGAGASHLCSACLEKGFPLAIHRSFARYEGLLKDVILLFKYRGFEILGAFLGDLLARAFAEAEDIWAGVEAIVPVPLHPRRKRRRGYNQAQLIARRLARQRNVELLDKHLVKIKDVPPQTSLEAGEREKNVRGAFGVRREQELAGKIVLLVDDVFTTGSTLRECSLVLRKAGVKETRAVTVAQA